MKYTPVLTGAAVGLIDGELGYALPSHQYAPGIFKFGTLGLGLLSEMMGWLTPNINYGAMTGASYLIGARIPAIFHDKTLKSIATKVAPSFYEKPTQRPTAAGLAAPAFGERSSQPPSAAGMRETGTSPNEIMLGPTSAGHIHTHSTIRGSVAPGCSACGSKAAASVAIPGRRTDIPERQRITAAGFVGTDYRAVNSKPTRAG